MLNEWSDRLPARPLSRAERIRRRLGFTLWIIIGLTAAAALLWQLGERLLRLGGDIVP